MKIIKVNIVNKTFHGLLFMLIGLFSTLSSADDSELNQQIKVYIADSMTQLVNKLDKNKDFYHDNAELFFSDLNSELSKVIDFKRIALKVMGKNVRTASDAQREQFVSKFKSSLFETYAKVLLESDTIEFEILNASINSRNKSKAKVNLIIKGSGGASYDVSYALHRGKDQIYRVENIIVLGVNLGLAYKDRFQEQVRNYKGNLDLVITNWSFKQT